MRRASAKTTQSDHSVDSIHIDDLNVSDGNNIVAAVELPEYCYVYQKQFVMSEEQQQQQHLRQRHSSSSDVSEDTEEDGSQVAAIMMMSSSLLTQAEQARSSETTATIERQQEEEAQRHQHQYSAIALVLLFLVPALGGFLYGYDVGATSWAIADLQDGDKAGVLWWRVVATSSVLQGTIVAMASIGALLGSASIFLLADRYRVGRRTELRLGAVFYIAGAALESQTIVAQQRWGAAVAPAKNLALGLAVLLVGRLLFGIGIGISMHGAPTFLAEVAPSAIRGVLVSLKEASIVLGMFMGYVLGLVLCSHQVGGWAVVYGASIIPATLMLILSFMIPRSARWLLSQGKEEEALASLRFLYDDQRAEQEFNAMQVLYDCHQTREGPPANQDDGTGSDNGDSIVVRGLFHRSRRAPLIAGLGLVVLQQITGQPSVLSYATTIFRDAGASDDASILIAGFKLIATSLAAITVERFGRKKLLYVGCTMMLAALVTLSLSYGRPDAAGLFGLSTNSVVIAAMFLYIGGYQVGFGPITWLIISEVFPFSVRGKAVAFAVNINFLLNAVVQFGVPAIVSLVGYNVAFGIFASLTAVSVAFVAVCVPETKGLALEQIEQRFNEESEAVSSEFETAGLEPLLPNRSID